MNIFECAPLWYAYIFLSASIIACAVYFRGSSRLASLAALLGSCAFALASIFRDPSINSDTVSYTIYSEMGRAVTALCFIVGMRFEPLSGATMWASANAGPGSLVYFLVASGTIILCSILLYVRMRERYILFAATTVPQFFFTMNLATIRWGMALYVLAAATAWLDRKNFAFRSGAAALAFLLHYGSAVAGSMLVFRAWYLRLAIAVAATCAAAVVLDGGELQSGSGLRYVIAAAPVAMLLLLKIETLRDDAFRDHTTLVLAAVILSALFFVSPHLTRFASSVLFLSYVYLGLSKTAVIRRVSVAAICLVPALVLAMEVRQSSCTIWAETMSGTLAEGIKAQEDAIRSQYLGGERKSGFLWFYDGPICEGYD